MAWELNSDRPIYSQLLDEIKVRIISGRYKPNDRIPSVRELAAEAGVNPNTMQRALMELERSGLIVTQRNAGRTVTDNAQLIERAKYDTALRAIQQFFHQMNELGYSDEQLLQLINNREEKL